MRWVIILLLFSSCASEQKAVRYFDRHTDLASKYCAAKFPIWERVDTVFTGLDSAAYNQAYYDLWAVVDSLIRNPIIGIIYDTVRVDSIRTVTRYRVREVLKPCLDSNNVVYIYQEDKGITAVIRKDLDAANKIAYHHKQLARMRLKIIFGLLALLLISTAYSTRKLWL